MTQLPEPGLLLSIELPSFASTLLTLPRPNRRHTRRASDSRFARLLIRLCPSVGTSDIPERLVRVTDHVQITNLRRHSGQLRLLRTIRSKKLAIINKRLIAFGLAGRRL